MMLCLICYYVLSITCLEFFKIPWRVVLSFPMMLKGCMFIIIDISQHPFVDFLDFCSGSFSTIVPHLVAVIKILYEQTI